MNNILKQSIPFTGWSLSSWRLWLWCLSLKSSQNLLHSPWRRRTWNGTYWSVGISIVTFKKKKKKVNVGMFISVQSRGWDAGCKSPSPAVLCWSHEWWCSPLSPNPAFHVGLLVCVLNLTQQSVSWARGGLWGLIILHLVQNTEVLHKLCESILWSIRTSLKEDNSTCLKKVIFIWVTP